MKTKLDILKANASMSNYDIGKLFENEGYKDGITESSIMRLRRKHNIPKPNVFSNDLLKDGFDGSKWSHGWLKNETSSVFIKNDEGFMTYEDIREELVEEMKLYAPKYPEIIRTENKDGHLLIIDPADVHIGKLSVKEETGENYDIKIAKKRCLDGVNGIIEKSKGFSISKIILVIGNDVLHRDNPSNTTTAGTRQDVSGMWWQAFKEAKDMYVKIVELLSTIADVQIVYCPSNHDYASGFMLADSLESWFHGNPNISFLNTIIHRKYVRYGLNMLGFDHGDGSKERDTKDLMADEEPKMWAQTKFRYVYKHHMHHKRKVNWISGKDFIGVTVEYLRTPSAIDGWHDRNGYRAPKAIEGFIHHQQNGQVARLTHYF